MTLTLARLESLTYSERGIHFLGQIHGIVFMKVAYYTGLHQLEIRQEPSPKIERPEDVLLRIDRVGICGSDVHYYSQGRIGQKCVQYPATLGHECSGTVVEVGAGGAGALPGERVVVDPAIACGQCDQCRAGRINTCRNVQFMGSPRRRRVRWPSTG